MRVKTIMEYCKKIYKISLIASVIFFSPSFIATTSVKTISNLSNRETLRSLDSRYSLIEKARYNELLDELSAKNTTARPNNTVKVGRDSDAITEYTISLRTAVLEGFIIKPEYSGMSCTVSISLAKDGNIQSLEAKEGDKQLCNDVINHLDNIKLPPAPNDKIYQLFNNNLSLRFKF